ncbi:MAG: hypothetical protein OXC46_03200 [Thaumarchaeota archaeon]|nr:hypothetical protein [Nitrososphaerota archaeon]
MVKLATKAEKLAKASTQEDRKSIRKLLRDDGVSGEIDKVIKKLLPEYAT